jgi:hypothetical protein
MSNAWERNLAVPFFSQRENKYTWYQLNEARNRVKENGVEKPGISMAWRSCNITSLCMVLHFHGVTEETPDDMMENIFAAEGWNKEANDESTNRKRGASSFEDWDRLLIAANRYLPEGLTSVKKNIRRLNNYRLK